jgi:hypothetical protein
VKPTVIAFAEMACHPEVDPSGLRGGRLNMKTIRKNHFMHICPESAGNDTTDSLGHPMILRMAARPTADAS